MTDVNDFYVDDEPVEEVQAAWARGEKGLTSGASALSKRARSTVARAVARWEDGERHEDIRAGDTVTRTDGRASALYRVRSVSVSPAGCVVAELWDVDRGRWRFFATDRHRRVQPVS